MSVIKSFALAGRIVTIAGPMVGVSGIERFLSIGDRIELHDGSGSSRRAEIAAFRCGIVSAMPLEQTRGLGQTVSAVVTMVPTCAMLRVADDWLGRVIDPLGYPLDGGGSLPEGRLRDTRAPSVAAMDRGPLGPPVDLGIRVLNAFTTSREGQRLGLFAGAGVGKTTLLGMLGRYVSCDVTVMALIGERGREVKRFAQETLGPAALRRAVMVAATSDASPMLRREALYAATAIAEHFRDQGRSVLLLVDSLTRFCQAMREIGLALGEVPGTRGWPPSVFAELPCLLERAGPGPEASGTGRPGSITGIYTVLVDGDDPNEPISDAARGMLDGHIWLDRSIAERGRFPAVDVARSLSRTAADCLTAEQRKLVTRARAVLARAAESSELLRLGVYARGSEPETDEVLAVGARLEQWLDQSDNSPAPLATVFPELAGVLGITTVE